MQAAKPANPVIAIHLIAISGGLEVPAGTEKLFACTRDDRHPEAWIVAKGGKGLAHNLAGRQINSIGFWTVQCDLKNSIFNIGFDRAHWAFLIKASAAIAVCSVQISGLISTSST